MTASEQNTFRRIRGAMVAAGVTNAQVARDEKVTPQYVHLVLTQQRTGYRIRLAIAHAVGMPVEELWPNTPPEYRCAA